jgi:hypothetical protein
MEDFSWQWVQKCKCLLGELKPELQLAKMMMIFRSRPKLYSVTETTYTACLWRIEDPSLNKISRIKGVNYKFVTNKDYKCT